MTAQDLEPSTQFKMEVKAEEAILEPASPQKGLCETAEKENPEVKDTQTFDIPRPVLTIQQAAAFLGRSVRALERSLLGRWGNKLPEGWSAKKVKTAGGDEWRILPPPGFRVRSHAAVREEGQPHAYYHAETSQPQPHSYQSQSSSSQWDFLASKKSLFKAESHSIEHPTIVIDRSEEVEHLLRELLSVQKTLAEERRLHMEDLRIVAQLQGSMRLLETSASENSRAKSELESAKRELDQMKEEYNRMLSLPWWKRLFAFKRG